MKKSTLISTLLSIILLSACEEPHFDEGKEFSIEEAITTTPFKAIHFETNESCKECHPTIYDEFTNSMHFKATVFRDKIHKAVWEQHPNFKNKTQYKCAQCHLPGADNIEAFMEEGGQALPDPNNASQNEAISCAACHKIKSIEKHRQANRNIYSEEKDAFYGIGEQLSIAHLTNNKNKMYRTGELCLGCHSHRENIKDYVVCITASETKEKSYKTCISCHMPQVDGPGSTNSTQRKHFFHGFAGANNNQEMLAKQVEFRVKKVANSKVELSIKNKAPHDLFLHPLRASFIKTAIVRDGKTIHTFGDLQMERVLKDKKGIAGCTNASRETKNTLIKGDQTTTLILKHSFRENDQLSVEFGYQLVKDDFIKSLGLENDKAATSYKIFKKEIILIE